MFLHRACKRVRLTFIQLQSAGARCQARHGGDRAGETCFDQRRRCEVQGVDGRESAGVRSLQVKMSSKWKLG